MLFTVAASFCGPDTASQGVLHMHFFFVLINPQCMRRGLNVSKPVSAWLQYQLLFLKE